MQDRAREVEKSLKQAQQVTLVVGVVAVVATVIGFFLNRDEFFRSYLLGYVMWAGMAVGCLALLMLHFLISGPWGFTLRRFLEAGAWPLPLLAALCVPLLFGLPTLYEWARPSVVAADPLLQHKEPYLNVPFFLVRTAVYLLVWAALAWLLTRWSRGQNEENGLELRRKARRLSGPGLVLFLYTASFAAIDWMMTLEPHWYSTLYGLIVAAGQILGSLALVLLASLWLRGERPLKDLVTPGIFYDLGNLLLGFLLLWVYLTFIQYMVIWSGNLPEEVPWVLHRTQGGWQVVLIAVLLLGFGGPFIGLVSTGFRPRIHVLMIVAPLVFIMQLVNYYWLVMPAFYPDGWELHWLNIAVPLALGGIWLAAGLHYLRRTPLLPRHDPRLKEIFEAREQKAAS